MKKDTLYKIVIGLLLLVNISVLAIHFMHRPPHRPHGDFLHKAKEILHLDSEQAEKFGQFSQKHHEQVMKIQNEERKLMKKYFHSPSEELLEEILEVKAKKLKVTTQHFNDVKGMLNKNQLEHYEKFRDQAITIIMR